MKIKYLAFKYFKLKYIVNKENILIRIYLYSFKNLSRQVKNICDIIKKYGGRSQVVRQWIVTPPLAGSNPVVRP